MGSIQVPEDYSGHKVYLRITFLGALVHLSQTIIFFFLKYPIPALYNVGSSCFYAIMLLCIRKKKYRMAVSLIHIEVSLFVISSIVFCGWYSGAGLYFFAFAALVYFCPYEKKSISYSIATTEAALYLLLFSVFKNRAPYYPQTSETALFWLYFYNAICSFTVIIYCAFMSNLSASVTNERLREENKKLSTLANYDYLTGLLTRLAFKTKLDSLGTHESIIIALGDIDDFKKINDTYSHNAGDYILQTVSSLIMLNCNLRTFPCRWGGEEFLFLFRNTSVQHALEEMEKLRDEIAQCAFSYKGVSIPVTITFGISPMGNSANIDALIAAADANLYHGKASGKNCVISPKELHLL